LRDGKHLRLVYFEDLRESHIPKIPTRSLID
jgi:hypothetical protein